MRIYIANLGKYNEGELVGAWFTPPVDFEEVKERIGLNDEYPYLLFTNSKILNCFVNRQHILLPDWNHLALYSFFYIIYYEHLQIFKIGSTLSANDNPHPIAGSHRQIKMQYR